MLKQAIATIPTPPRHPSPARPRIARWSAVP